MTDLTVTEEVVHFKPVGDFYYRQFRFDYSDEIGNKYVLATVKLPEGVPHTLEVVDILLEELRNAWGL